MNTKLVVVRLKFDESEITVDPTATVFIESTPTDYGFRHELNIISKALSRSEKIQFRAADSNCVLPPVGIEVEIFSGDADGDFVFRFNHQGLVFEANSDLANLTGLVESKLGFPEPDFDDVDLDPENVAHRHH